MTREEAIYWIKNLAVLSTEKDMASITEALNMAIEALKQLSLPKIIIRQGEQEPTAEYSSDVISRQAAIDAIEPTLKSILQGNSYKAVNVMDKIRDLPSAQPFTSEQIQTMQELESAQVEKAYELGKADRPTGHWIENDNGTFSCSNCQSWIPKEQHHYARHCLYCGARMESDTE